MSARTLFLGATIISTVFLTSIAEASLKIVERHEWGAKSYSESPTTFPNIPSYVLIRDTKRETCFFPEECKATVRSAQNEHMESDYRDIVDNFRIGADGVIYVGRGWDVIPPDPYNHKMTAIVITLMGTFNEDVPTNVQLRSAQLLLELGMNLKKIRSNYKLLASQQVLPFQLGNKLYKIIKTWPHWSPVS